MELSHLNDDGNARMVDVGEKEVTLRIAVAEGFVEMQPDTLKRIKDGGIKKGDVLNVAAVAGINGAKHTWENIPMCHSIPLNGCDVRFEYASATVLRIEATVSATARTGVEMEAMSAVSAAALTVYDMCKAIDREMTISSIRLLEKSGGESGLFKREL